MCKAIDKFILEKDFSFNINNEIKSFKKDYVSQMRKRKKIKTKLESKQDKLGKIMKEIDSFWMTNKAPIEKYKTRRESKLSMISLAKNSSQNASPSKMPDTVKKISKNYKYIEDTRKSIKENLNTTRKFSVVDRNKLRYVNQAKKLH